MPWMSRERMRCVPQRVTSAPPVLRNRRHRRHPPNLWPQMTRWLHIGVIKLTGLSFALITLHSPHYLAHTQHTSDTTSFAGQSPHHGRYLYLPERLRVRFTLRRYGLGLTPVAPISPVPAAPAAPAARARRASASARIAQTTRPQWSRNVG